MFIRSNKFTSFTCIVITPKGMGAAVPAIAANVDSARAQGHAYAAKERADEAVIDQVTGNPIGAELNQRSAIGHTMASGLAAGRSTVEAGMAGGLGGSGIAALGANAAANSARGAVAMGAGGAGALGAVGLGASPLGVSGIGYPGAIGGGYPGLGVAGGYPYSAGFGAYPYGAYPYGYGAGMNRGLASGALATGAAIANGAASSALASSVGVGSPLGVSY